MIYAVLSAVFASLTAILGKVGIEGVDSNLGTAIRTTVVLVMAWLMVMVKGKWQQIKTVEKKEFAFVMLSGLETGASWLCYYRALQTGQASVVVPIDKLSILVTIAFSWIVFREKLFGKAVLGLIGIVAGLSLIHICTMTSNKQTKEGNRQMAESILVVDDEQEIADLVEVYLQNEGYTVHKFYNAKDALNCLDKTTISLALLDVMLPDMDGFSLCRQIRQKFYFPIIMLTAKVEDMAKIMGLTVGADDYITKPFNPLELMARVKTQLRRYTRYNTAGVTQEQDEEIDIRGMHISNISHKCMLNGQEIALTPLEFEMCIRDRSLATFIMHLVSCLRALQIFMPEKDMSD